MPGSRHGSVLEAVRSPRSRGYTLVEVVIVVAVLGIVALIALPVYGDFTQNAKVARAIEDIRTLEREIQVYEFLHGTLPATLADIHRENLTDPWNNPYEYLNFAAAGPSANGKRRKDKFLVPINSTFDLYSKGKDGDSQAPLTAAASRDDIVRASDGAWVGVAVDY